MKVSCQFLSCDTFKGIFALGLFELVNGPDFERVVARRFAVAPLARKTQQNWAWIIGHEMTDLSPACIVLSIKFGGIYFIFAHVLEPSTNHDGTRRNGTQFTGDLSASAIHRNGFSMSWWIPTVVIILFSFDEGWSILEFVG